MTLTLPSKRRRTPSFPATTPLRVAKDSPAAARDGGVDSDGSFSPFLIEHLRGAKQIVPHAGMLPEGFLEDLVAE